MSSHVWWHKRTSTNKGIVDHLTCAPEGNHQQETQTEEAEEERHVRHASSDQQAEVWQQFLSGVRHTTQHYGGPSEARNVEGDKQQNACRPCSVPAQGVGCEVSTLTTTPLFWRRPPAPWCRRSGADSGCGTTTRALVVR